MLPFGLVTKGGWGSPHIEADNIRFVAHHTSIPVPRILDAIEYRRDPTTPSGLIVMTRIEGESLAQWISDHAIRPPGQQELLEKLDHCISRGDMTGISETLAQLKPMPPPTLDLSDATLLIEDLRNAFRELRALPAPSAAVAGLLGRPLKCNRDGDLQFVGPFQDQQEFKDSLFAQANSVLSPHRMPALRRLAEPVNAKRHRVCFTHADLAARNILVKNGRLSGIIDWEYSGWYPEYWELVTMERQMIDEPLMHQFWDAVQLFGPEPYRDELALEWALRHCTGASAAVCEQEEDLSCPRCVVF
ncbi:hypothetical protein TRAPUB_12130 [Trametes pubescens]|uniref:Aminoglycoside phosphotransferase domain-containing protein n=1 Tax=Trametes pubescens TaxID=154538 RepID=A0A1M2VUZ2_TRAPU|nr:hypothetical protein TRAPUB_12130 [Trametes pubescens]